MAANKAVVVNASGAIVAPVSAATFRNNNGLQIGLNIQAWSSDLDNFVTNGSWSGTTLVLAAGLNVGTALNVGTVLTVNEIQMGASGILALGAGSTITINSVAVPTISSSNTLTNKTIDLGSNTLTATSLQLKTAVSDETGSGSLVFGTSPTLTTPSIASPTITGTLDASGVTNDPTVRFDLGVKEPRVHFPKIAQALYNQRYAGIKTQFSVGFVGDSLADLAAASYEGLLDQVRIAGICIGGGIGAIGGQTYAGGAAVTTNDFARWWRGSYDTVPSGGSVIYDYNTTDDIFSDTLKVYYLKESGAGTFKIQLSRNGGAYADEGGTIDTDNASASSGVVSIDKSSLSGWYRVKIVGLTGTVRILGARFSHSDLTGAVPFSLSVGGSDFANWDDVGAAVLAPVLSDLDPKLIYFANTGDTTTNNLDTMYSRLNTAIGSTPDYYINGVWPQQSGADVAQNVILRTWADTNNLPYASPVEEWKDWATLDAQGYATDGSHPTAAAVYSWHQSLAGIFTPPAPPKFSYERISPITNILVDGTPTGDVETGYHFGGNVYMLGNLDIRGASAGIELRDRTLLTTRFIQYLDNSVWFMKDPSNALLMKLDTSAGRAFIIDGSGPTTKVGDTSNRPDFFGRQLDLSTPVPISSGGSAVATQPAFSVHKNGSAQSINPSGFVKLTWSTEEYDTDNAFASDKFTPQVAGKYRLTISTEWAGATTTNNPLITVFKNGSEYKRIMWPQYSGTSSNQISGSVTVVANGSTDYFEAYVYHDDTAPRNVNGGESKTYFQGHFIRT